MKTFVKTLLFFAVMTICSSCKNTNPPSNEIQSEEPLFTENQLWLPVIKFTNSLYINHILATEKGGITGDSVFGIGSLTEPDRLTYSQWVQTHNIIGKIPFIELTDNFLLLDWHWYPMFGYLKYDTYNANLALAVLTKENWTDLRGINQIWEKTVAHDHNAIAELHQFKVKALDDYRGDKTYMKNGWEKHLWFAVVQYAFMRKTDAFPNGVDEYKLDSLQSIYVDCLKKIIEDKKISENEGWIREIK